MTSDRQRSTDQSKSSVESGSNDKAQANVDQLSLLMENGNVETGTAYDTAQEALAESDISAEHELYARRYASEAAARTVVGEDAIDLDAFVKKRRQELRGNSRSFQGDNYPTYDITSHTEVASVKTHWNIEGELTESAKAEYKRNFSKMLGWGRSVGALENDGENIVAIRDTEGPVPPELKQANKTEAAEYLRDNARLRIPDDHVKPLREVLEKDIHTYPSNYYLPENPSQEQVEHILNRVQGIGLTSTEIRKLIDERISTDGQ